MAPSRRSRDLEQVWHEHVAESAGPLIEVRSRTDRQRLGHVDLDMFDVVVVPDRLEHAVCEADCEQVLHRLLAEVVVDPEHLRLVQDLVHARVELSRRGEIGSEWLLHDHARALIKPERSELLDDAGRCPRGNREVVQQPGTIANLLLRARHPLAQRAEPLRVPTNESRAPRTASQDSAVGCFRPNSSTAALAKLAELFVGKLAARPSRRSESRSGIRPASCQVEHSRQELALREIAGRPEQDDHIDRPGSGTAGVSVTAGVDATLAISAARLCSTCPPNCLRIADSSLSAKSASPRDLKRS